MSVVLDDDKVVLSGDCTVEDAEPLLILLHNHPDCPVDIDDATNLHAAVLQVLMVFKRDLIGSSRDSFLQRWVLPVLAERVEEPIG
jgi:hypothetical protein